ncbi:hypothetical protein Q2T40_16310 [Winogradskyella maritima]|uniref:Antibiotic biosynthesis monooxygenase n=1 Tax=Winogradskyella maritima TaxID=1517766 RepID=A0ABV8AFL7_9FLAO|nr:hypothetical protein [Winogradskyella maritima]
MKTLNISFLLLLMTTTLTFGQQVEAINLEQHINQQAIGKVGIRTTFEFKESEAEKSIEHLQKLSQFATGKSNPIFYRFFQNVEKPEQIVLFEEWASVADYQNETYQSYRHKCLNDLVKAIRGVKWYRAMSNEREKHNTADLAFLDTIPATAPTAQKTLDRLNKVGMGTSPFVLFVDVPIKKEGITATRKSVAQIQVETLKEERAIHYGYFQNLEDAGDFLLFEWWTESDGMNDHLQYDYFVQLMKTFGAFGGDGRKIGIYRPLKF